MSNIQGTPIYKMSGAGNDFVVLDGRGVDVSEFRRTERIREVCAEFRTDGLMILDVSDSADFRMEFYNPDGSGGMMCGNGGRCIIAFADFLGITPADGHTYRFLAPDGPHSAEIISRPESGRMVVPCGTPFASLTPAPPIASDGPLPLPLSGGGQALRGLPSTASKWTIRLEMKNVDGVQEVLGGYFLNTGTRHFVKFVEDVDAIDIEKEGKELRWNKDFAPEGTNVNFVQVCEDRLKIRTFEKGVEGETLACGTGITASALAAYAGRFLRFARNDSEGRNENEERNDRTSIRIQARRGDILTVDFTATEPGIFRNIHLTGPAEFI